MLRGLVKLLLISTLLIHLCTCVQHPELLLEGSAQGVRRFCQGETAQLKCIFPVGERAAEWYVNGSSRSIHVDYLADDLPGHNATTPFGNYTILSVTKEEPYRGNYRCGVNVPSPGSDIRSNSVEIIFEDTEPEGITATCISTDSDSIIVAVNYTNGCRRETVVEANGMICEPLLTANRPTTALFNCSTLYSNTSYNIMAKSQGYVDYCGTMIVEQRNNDASSMDQTYSVYLAFLGVPLVLGLVFAIVLAIGCYQHQKGNQGKAQYQLDSHDEEAYSSGEAMRTPDEISTGNKSPLDSESPDHESLQRSDSDESSESASSARHLMPQHKVHDQGLNYAVIDHSGPRLIQAPPPHENVKYSTTKPEL